MTIQELKPSKRVRDRWLAVQEDGSILPIDAAGFRFKADTHIMVAGRPDNVSKMVNERRR